MDDDIDIGGSTGPASATGRGCARARDVAGRDHISVVLEQMGTEELLVYLAQTFARYEPILDDMQRFLAAWRGNGAPGLGEHLRRLRFRDALQLAAIMIVGVIGIITMALVISHVVNGGVLCLGG